MKPETLALIQGGQTKKGDVIGIARIGAIQAAKRTSDLIPLAHPLAITRVTAEFVIHSDQNAVECIAAVEKAIPALVCSCGTPFNWPTAVQAPVVDRHLTSCAVAGLTPNISPAELMASASILLNPVAPISLATPVIMLMR